MSIELNLVRKQRPLKSFLLACIHGLRIDAILYSNNGVIESGSAFHGIVNRLIDFGYSPKTAVSAAQRLEKMARVKRG